MAARQKSRDIVALIVLALNLGTVGCAEAGGASPRPTPSSSSVSPSSLTVPSQVASCGSFDHPIDALESPGIGEVTIAEGSGCGAGQVTANGGPFMVDRSSSVWILYFAYTCSGTYQGMGDPALKFTAYNTLTGADAPPVVQPGPWGYGGGGLTSGNPDVPPAGKYLIRVTVANPEAHTCRWRAAVRRR